MPSVWPAVDDVDTSGSASPVSVVSVPVQHHLVIKSITSSSDDDDDDFSVVGFNK